VLHVPEPIWTSEQASLAYRGVNCAMYCTYVPGGSSPHRRSSFVTMTSEVYDAAETEDALPHLPRLQRSPTNSIWRPSRAPSSEEPCYTVRSGTSAIQSSRTFLSGDDGKPPVRLGHFLAGASPGKPEREREANTTFVSCPQCRRRPRGCWPSPCPSGPTM
jgi:hypothetical protein